MADNGGNLGGDEWMRRDDPRQGRRLLIIAAGILLVLIVLVATFSIWGKSGPKHPEGLPVISAPDGPDRIEPEDPGGLNVPHRDKLVYDRITGEHKPRVEHLLPDAEEPMQRDQIAELIEQDQTPEERAADGDAEGDETVIVYEEAAPANTATEPAPKPTPKPASKPDTKPAPQQVENNGPVIGKSDWLLQLAAFRTLGGAQTAWERLKKNRADLLGDLSPDYQKVTIDGQGAFHRLRVGPFADKSSATARCERLKAVKQDCLLIAPR